MELRQHQDETTLYLTQTLKEYEIVPATWGWHIHQGNVYCGHLGYQGIKGWQGTALSCLPNELKEQLTKFAQSGSSMREVLLEQSQAVLNQTQR
ncbi:MAG: hypothetical protein JO235_29065 [Chroococcidiopsidaceae cyanobacterium CP_BM_RX_35]|nr:hypothetical protein [Chroococcidiopsidaceae cyanobacterium CP_BM_RX_35]